MEMTRTKRDAIITSLYERCSKGEISVAQRESLIQKTNSMFIATESTKEPVVDTVNEEKQLEISPMDKYDLFKESVYQKCAKGEITLENREELLAKARDKFFTIPE